MSYAPKANPQAIANVNEFKELARANNLICESVEYQVIKKPAPSTFIGTGKIQELKEKLIEKKVKLIIFDKPLSGVQLRNLEKALSAQVMDRHQLILNIFAGRATTYEGKLQVKLAQYMDELPRMVGAWMSSLSRQGGGIGSKGGAGAKGPGEKAIERDRRQVQLRIKKIRQKLAKISRTRCAKRTLRQKNKVPSISLIGYTNSGKSTLLNKLTKSTVPVQNLPFMTLDPTTRQVHIPGIPQVVMTDTVGFIQNLSPHLIDAFKSTLEESAQSDILLHVIDASTPLMKVQINTVNTLLKELAWDNKPCLYVYNKIDNVKQKPLWHTHTSHPKVLVSAKTGEGLDNLRKTLSRLIAELKTEVVQLYFPKEKENHIYTLEPQALIERKESSSLGTLCYVRLTPYQLKKWEKFMV